MTHDALPYDSAYFTTITGRRVCVAKPEIRDVCLEDIAHALARVCRFGGHVREHLSVAVHCVLVSRIVEETGGTPEQQLHGLLHDAAEAYIGDMISPLKQFVPEFKEVEWSWQEAIGLAFGLGYKLCDGDPLVKQADIRAFHTEWRDNFPERIPCLDSNPAELYGGPMAAPEAKQLFLVRYQAVANRLEGTHGALALDMLRSVR